MKKPKIIAFYLPHFHEIAENNERWGEGFTDWICIKKTAAWFMDHRQPRIPYKNNYYDLSKFDVQEWQSELALKYGISGFCYYHYWFNGKLLYEKPMEMMRINPIIEIPFCINWVNESFTGFQNGGKQEIIITQEEDSEEEWEKHFKYLLPFFKDRRYIRVDNKPVFLIYNYPSIKNGDAKIQYFQKLAKENNLAGLHIVSTLHGHSPQYTNSPFIDASARLEPMYTLKHRLSLYLRVKFFLKRKIIGGFYAKAFGVLMPKLRNIDYDEINHRISKELHFKSEKPIYNGAFVGWDNTPRCGIDALIVDGDMPGSFGFYLGKALDTAIKNNSEFVFLNAWNGWADGAYLEPDIDNRYDYLEAVKQQLMKRGLYEEVS